MEQTNPDRPASAEKDTASVNLSSGEDDSRSSPRRPLSKRILAVIWDSLDKTPEERRFIAKIDWWILSYCCIAYFVKYLDQTNVSNAYVSGMKEDLSMTGNDLNYLTTYWNIGYILGQLPSQYMLTKIRPSIWLPTLELSWGFIVMGMAGSKSVTTISAAQMFSGAGLAAWRWLFIFDGIIGIPIAVYGYWAIPDAPTSSKARWLKPRDREIAVSRMEKVGRAPLKRLTWGTIRDILANWPIWLFSSIFIAHVCAIKIYSYFNLWLKSTHLYSTEEVNIIPTAGYGLQIVCTLTYAWVSDAVQSRWPLIIVACLVALIGTIILSIWPSGNISAMMAGWLLTFCETGAGALIITWINEICGHNAEHRAIIIGVVETMAFTFSAWVPLLVYNTGEAPHFKIGYQIAAMFFSIEIVLTVVILFCWRRWPQG
ncbi:putative pantothenate protein [Phaeoacremonium minimum UCRPA7]|uniref:Putative pantothenate protein n=1 Tax=Phaeoacremonium minimum (strain UCR-PA7) TaxID=1286976 RepID=R8B9C7_PHAM7|nr:putative pantothenate protein [Phaeoacremonium minimum UCRPA7]EON95892.1 putative pantothenate protein [Phaeoacremonium minimum UCRPA7]